MSFRSISILILLLHFVCYLATSLMSDSVIINPKHFAKTTAEAKTMVHTAATTPQRQIICADSLHWMKEMGEFPGNVFTSLPDVAELTGITNYVPTQTYFPHERFVVDDLIANNVHNCRLKLRNVLYKEWFVNCLVEMFSKIPVGGYAIFLQSPLRVIDADDGSVVEWIDKADLIAFAANIANSMTVTKHKNNASSSSVLLQSQILNMKWHKITSLIEKPFEKKCSGRPPYSHLICYGKGPESSFATNTFNVPDIFYRGDMLWSKGIGLSSAIMGIAFLKEMERSNRFQAPHRSTVIDPFCGIGTIPAMANVLEMNSIGVEISPRRARRAAALDLSSVVAAMSPSKLSFLGMHLSAEAKADCHQSRCNAAVVSEGEKEGGEEEEGEEEGEKEEGEGQA